MIIFYGRVETGRERIQGEIESFVDRMSDDVDAIRAFEVNTVELMISGFFRTFIEEAMALKIMRNREAERERREREREREKRERNRKAGEVFP